MKYMYVTIEATVSIVRNIRSLNKEDMQSMIEEISDSTVGQILDEYKFKIKED